MKTPTILIRGKINPTIKIKGKTNVSIVKIYPELEELEVNPTLEEQELTPDKYGFSKVLVNGIPATDLEVTATEEEQVAEGIFKKVYVNPIPTEEKTIEPDFNNVDQIEIIPTEESYLKKVTLIKDIDLDPANIKKGKNIFGIDGEFDAVDTRDATATAEDIAEGKTAYSNGEKLTGTLEKYNLLVDTSVSVGNGLGVTLRTILVKANGLNYSTATCPQGFSSYYNLEEVSFKTFNKTTKQFYNMFSGCKKLKKVEGLNPVKGENFQYMFSGCSSLEESPEFETPCATDFKGMFDGCTSLKKVICYNTSKLHEVGIEDMFNNCPNLTDESLDNIMYMCKKASKTTTKTLAYVGLSEAQATRCQSLSNYQAFLDAGWTTGF